MEWVAFYELEPWGESLNGMRMAANTSAVLNAGLMMANPKRLRSKPFHPKDFWIGVNSGQSSTKKEPWELQKARVDMLLDMKRKRSANDSRKPGCNVRA